MLAEWLQARLMFKIVEVTGMWFERAWQWAKEHLMITVPGAVLVFATTYVLMLAVHAGEAGAAWVQAIGSIMALIGAIYLPIVHGDHVVKKRQQNVLCQMRLLAEDCYENLWKLTNCFLLAEKESQIIDAYLAYGKANEWDAIVTALNQIAIHDVPPDHLQTLTIMRTAAAHAVFVCGCLRAWKTDGSNPEVVELLRSRRDKLGIKKSSLPWSEGVTGAIDNESQKRGIEYERERPPLNPMYMHGVKVYRQYIGINRGSPEAVRVQIVFPYGEDGLITFVLDREGCPGWQTLDEAEDAVRIKAMECISDINSRYL